MGGGVAPTGKMGDFGLLACRLGPGDWLKWVPGGLPGGVKPEEFDHFHEAIATEELARSECGAAIETSLC